MHRDIKPGNILLSQSGQVKLADFGVSTEGQENALSFVGTKIYMSPERIQGLPYSFDSDIWSLGLVLVHCADRLCSSTSADYFSLHHLIVNRPPPQLPEGKFSAEFRDFVSRW